MDHSKSIKPELVDIWDPGQVEASKTWYKRASQESDAFQQDFYQNCAIYRSKKLAHQETMKMYQKKFDNKVFSRDSGSVIMHVDGAKFGLDSSRVKKSSFSGEAGEPVRIISDGTQGHRWISESSRETPISEKYHLYSRLRTLSEQRPSVKWVVAWFMFLSDYFQSIPDEWVVYWNEELRSLEAISDTVKIHYKQVLWEHSDFSRYEIRRALEILKSELKPILGRQGCFNV